MGQGKAGRRHVAFDLLKPFNIDERAAAYLTLRCAIQSAVKGSRAQVAARMIAEAIADHIEASTFANSNPEAAMVTRIDRLARSVADLETIVGVIKDRGAYLRATEQPIDTSTPAGVAFLQMLGVFAQFETALRRERQMEGISKAKAKGVYKGRKPSVPVDEVRRLKAEGIAPTEISRRLKIGRGSVYRVLGAGG